MGQEALEWWVRASVWASVLAWAWVMAVRVRGRVRSSARWIWTLGWVAYLVHALAAFGGFYGWSHARAVAETARQTAEATGLDSGAGIWFNYAFGAVWLADVARWWAVGTARYLQRGGWRRVADGFMAFMIFNGTVVFGRGVARWVGVGLFVGLAAWWLAHRRGGPMANLESRGDAGG